MITKSAPPPCIEQTKFLLASLTHDLRLSSAADGNVRATEKPPDRFVGSSGEEWLLESCEDGAFVIRSAEHGRHLAPTADGGVATLPKGGDEAAEEEGGSDDPKGAPSAGAAWRVEQSPHGGVFLSSSADGRRLACDDRREVYAVDAGDGKGDGWMAWKIEFLSGELCFVSSPAHDRRIKCDPFGNISTSGSWKGWEVWRFVEAGDGNVYITSWTHKNYYLSSTPDGNIFGSHKRGGWDKWAVIKAPGGVGVIIRSVAHGKVLGSDGSLLYTTDDVDGPEIWHLEAANRGVYFVSSVAQDKRIGCAPAVRDKPGGLFTSEKRKAYEQWVVEKTGDGEITLRSIARQVYLGSNEDGEVTTSPSPGDSEVWCAEHAANGGVTLISNAHHMRLSCDAEGKLRTVPEENGAEGEADAWNLEPLLPASLTGKQVGALCAAGAATVAVAAVMPFAVMGVLGGLGFTAEGVAAGSTAAGMMSAEAVASGGGVAAGGLVATLQSTGAAGLGLMGMSAAIGGGALIGSSVSAAAIAGTGILDSEKTAADDAMGVNRDASILKRPFCAWRSW